MTGAGHYKLDIGGQPPEIGRHSLVKHEVIRYYLVKYISTLSADPRRDVLRMTIVDGFAGGGVYQGEGNGGIVLGSPLLLLDAVKQAEAIEQARRRKPFRFEANFIFLEKRRKTADYLQHTLKEYGYGSQIGGRVNVVSGEFADHVNHIVEAIRQQSGTHRALFLLDQYGYSSVKMRCLSYIMSTLPKSEIILTFAVEWLVDYLADTPQSHAILDSLGLRLADPIKSFKNESPNNWKRAVQLCLHQQFPQQAGAKYYTPFFIRSAEAHRSYWLLHLSGHAKARDVMAQLHWEKQNAFEHFGRPGLSMLGYDPKVEVAQQGFGHLLFDKYALESAEQSLMDDLPLEIPRSPVYISVEELFASVANNTPATYDTIVSTIRRLHKEGEVSVKNEHGRFREAGCQLTKTDRVTRIQRPLIFKY